MTGGDQRSPRWAVLAVLVAAGVGIAVTASLGTPGRSAASYAAGLVVAAAVLLAAAVLVGRAAARSPVLGLVMAMACYAVTILGFAVLLVLLDPAVIEVRAWAAGLAVGGVIATLTALRRGSAYRGRR